METMSLPAFLRKLFLVMTVCALLTSTMLFTGSQARRRGRGRHRGRPLPDPGLLLVPAIWMKMNRSGKIFRDTSPDLLWVVQRIDNSDYEMSCDEVIYATLVNDRDPQVQYHRTCDSQHLWSGRHPRKSCNPASALHSNLCQPQRVYRVVRVRGRERYQESFSGCVCSATTAWTTN